MNRVRTSTLLLIVLVSGTLLVSCSEPSLIAPVEEKTTQKAVQPIIGSWQWVETVNFGGVRTPETTGHSESYVFTTAGKLSRYRDAVLISTTEYVVSTAGEGSSAQGQGGTRIVLHLSDEPDCLYTVDIKGGTMKLTCSQEDAGVSTFAKAN